MTKGRITPQMVTELFDRMAGIDAAQTRAYFVGIEVERDAALAEVERLRGIIAEARVQVDAARSIVTENLLLPRTTEGIDFVTRALEPILAKVVPE